MRSLVRVGTPFAEKTWSALASPRDEPCPRLDPGSLEALPGPARRLLRRSLPEGSRLSDRVELDMDGQIKLGNRWFDFTARQILKARVGFVWTPVVGRFATFTGADALGPEGARMEFRLFGLIPVIRGSGADIARSAAGRLAAETVAWLPHALTPQLGARWDPIDDRRAAVTLDVSGHDVRVEVAVDDYGQLEWLGLQRWKDSAIVPFGGSVSSSYTHADGIRIAGAGTVGWDWQTPRQSRGEFFRYRVVMASFDAQSGGDFRPC